MTGGLKLIKYLALSKTRTKDLIKQQSDCAKKLLYTLSSAQEGLMKTAHPQLQILNQFSDIYVSPSQLPVVSVYCWNNFDRHFYPSPLSSSVYLAVKSFDIKASIDFTKIRDDISKPDTMVQLGLISFKKIFTRIEYINSINSKCGQYEVNSQPFLPVALIYAVGYYSNLFEVGDVIPLIGVSCPRHDTLAIKKYYSGWYIVDFPEADDMYYPEYEVVI